MKINYIALENIGPYIKRNEFDFSTDESKNIILIGGKNGSGKTTLLKSIKIALFGCYALGLKTESITYYNYLKKLFNDRAILNDNSKFSLEVEFEFVQDYEKATYKILRSWRAINDFLEEVSVSKNGYQLIGNEFEEFNEEFRSLFPPKLLDALLFDGEEVAKYFTDNLINEYLKELLTNLLNLDLLDYLDSDLLQYVNRIEKNKQDSSDYILYKNKEQIVKRLQNEKKDIENHLNRLKQKFDDNKLNIDQIDRTFNNHGGLTEDEKNGFIRQLKEIEKSKIKSSNEIKYFLENLYPFAINKNLLIQTKQQLQSEKPTKFINYLNELQVFLNGQFGSAIQQIKHHLIELEDSNKLSIHYHTQLDDVYLDTILESISEEKIKYFQDLYISYLTSHNQMQNIKKIIEQNENTKELAFLLEKKDILISENKTLEGEILTSTTQLEDLGINLAKQLKSLEVLRTNVEIKNKENNNLHIIENILRTKDIFKQYLLDTKLHEIEKLATNIFCRVNRKENYISSICINQNTFELKITSPDGGTRDAEKFSAGERQLLFASILIAIIKLTELQSIMVFDTPLARLDREHSYSFVNSIIKNAGKQVLVLSTDDEIVGGLYEALKPQISKEYILNYDEKNNRTFLKPGYFID